MDSLSRFEMPPTERNQLILSQTVVHTRCRVCLSPITPALDLGEMFVSDFPERLEDRGPKVPLTLAVCGNQACSLVQLTHTVPRDALYRTRYWYRSGVNESMRQELQDVAQWGLERAEVACTDVVLDIGANDGTLLAAVRTLSAARRWAVEPSPSFLRLLEERVAGVADRIIQDYFPVQLQDYSDPFSGVRPKLIFSIAMFYDLERPHSFVQEIDRILHPEGVWVVQMGDFASMLQSGGFDTICHEHLQLYTLRSFMHLLRPFNLEVIDATISQANGGSLRIAVGRKDWELPESVQQDVTADERVEALLHREAVLIAGPDDQDEVLALRRFSDRIHHDCTRVQQALLSHSAGDRPIELLGASTKGNTLLQRLNLGPELCRRAIERAPEKRGRLTVTGIPIVGEEEGKVDPAPLRLVTPWHFRKGLVEREQAYLASGGKLLFPLPSPVIVEWINGAPREWRV